MQDAKVRKAWPCLGCRKASRRRWHLKDEIAIDQRKRGVGEGTPGGGNCMDKGPVQIRGAQGALADERGVVPASGECGQSSTR